MNFQQAKKIMSDLVPKDITWSIDLEHWYNSQGTTNHKHQEVRRVWLGNPIRESFGNKKTWQSAVDQALVALRNEGLIK